MIDEDKSLTNEQDLNSSENNTIIFPNRNSIGKTNISSQIFSEDKENYDPNMNINPSSPYSNSNNSILSSINLSSQEIKDAFYVPKKLNSNNIYNNNPYSNSTIN